MLRYALIFLLAVIFVICLQFGLLTQAERQCDDNDSSFTLLELILLFPVSLLDDNKCACELEDVTNTSSIVFQFVTLIEYVYSMLVIVGQTVFGSLASVGATLYELIPVVSWTSNYASIIETINPSSYISNFLTYIWNLDPVGSVIHVLTVYVMSLLPTCIQITEQIAYILPKDVITTMMDEVHRVYIDLMESPVWVVRLGAVLLLAVSLIISLYKNSRNNSYRKQLQSLKNVSEHHLMCEIFDNDKCNCGGKVPLSNPGIVKHVPLHYGMCESFDQLPCNCGGIVKNQAISESNNDDDSLLYIGKEVGTLSDQSTGAGLYGTSSDDLPNTVTSEEQTLNFLEYFNEIFVTDDEYNAGIYHDINVENLSQDTENLHNTDDDGQSHEFEDLMKDHYQMCECFDSQPCNCGGRSLSSSEVIDCRRDSLGTKDINQYTEEHIFRTSPHQKDGLTNKSPQHLDDSDQIPNNVYFDCELNTTDESLCYNKATAVATKDRSLTREESEGEVYNYTEDISESDIGAPYCNSSFREESQYVTANKSVTFEDTFAGGDGVSSLSTLTRRSPFIEQGLEDLVTDESFVDAETSILDISSIENSISYAAGDGVFEFAVMFIAQTAWRWVYSLWRRKVSPKNIQDLTVKETSPGLFLIGQKNKQKSYLTARYHRNNSASVEEEDDDGYHGDQELDVSETGVVTSIDSEMDNSLISLCDGNNNAKELKKATDTKNPLADDHVQHNKESESVQESLGKPSVEESRGNFRDGYNDDIEDSSLESSKLSKFNALLEKAQQFNCNIWELRDATSETLHDGGRRLLTWAWSSLGEDI